MKTQFKITGLYYEIQGYKFRKYLDVQKKNSSQKSPQLICLLMNPGGSKPIDGVDDNTVESEAIPDRTQSQIMKVMLNAGFEYARVLNLSDVREPKSNVFYKKMAELDTKGIAHSIFDESRKDDFNNLWVSGIPVIFGWGVSHKLKKLALKAMAVCNVQKPYGVQKPGVVHGYFHPLPPIYSKQQEWVKEVSKQLKS
jgi:hypothetical protein